MKVIALVSGGKDSTFNMMECVRMGHQIVALANLFPAGAKELELGAREDESGAAAAAPDEADELDSYCFQTVGHTVIAAYAECMGVPLHRSAIAADGSKNKDMVYEVTHDDEVEDLYQLLAEVKRLHPEADAVSSGAVLSDYQRLRVEHVCARLGLTSLGFMWRRPQQPLLRTMIERGVVAIVIKVAAMGLKPSHLGQTIEALEPKFCELEDLYGNHAAGEGGEYETLTLDSPMFSHALVIDEARVVTVSADKFAPVAFQHVTEFHVEAKPPSEPELEPEHEPSGLGWTPADPDRADWGTMEATARAQRCWQERAEQWCTAAAAEEKEGGTGACAALHAVSGLAGPLELLPLGDLPAARAAAAQRAVAAAGSGAATSPWLHVVASARLSEASPLTSNPHHNLICRDMAERLLVLQQPARAPLSKPQRSWRLSKHSLRKAGEGSGACSLRASTSPTWGTSFLSMACTAKALV